MINGLRDYLARLDDRREDELPSAERLGSEMKRSRNLLSRSIKYRSRKRYLSADLMRDSLGWSLNAHIEAHLGFFNNYSDQLNKEVIACSDKKKRESLKSAIELSKSFDPLRQLVIYVILLELCQSAEINEQLRFRFCSGIILGSIMLTHPNAFYCISPELFEALSQTNPPQQLTAINLFANQGFILTPDTQCAIYFHSVNEESGKSSNTKSMAFALWEDGGFSYRMFDLDDTTAESQDVVSPDQSAKDRVKAHQNLFLNLIYLLSQHPELIGQEHGSTSTINTVKGFGSDRGTQSVKLNMPIMIGGSYRIKKEKSSGNGTHASPVAHWRRGHWRQQPIGSKDNPGIKNIWIEPVLVNAGV